MGLRNLDLPFGVQNEVLYDVVDIMKRDVLPKKPYSLWHQDWIFSSKSKEDMGKVDTPLFRKILEGLSSSYDYILIDCPPGRGLAYRSAVSAVNDILFVVEPTWSSIRDTDRLIQYCHKHHFSDMQAFLIISIPIRQAILVQTKRRKHSHSNGWPAFSLIANV